MSEATKLLFLGVGNVALAVNEHARQYDTKYGTTRRTDFAKQLENLDISPIVLNEPVTRSPVILESVRQAADGSDVLVSFPPDGTTDQLLSSYCVSANKIVYVSSTGVYGSACGVINEDTEIDRSAATARARVDAENQWLELGAVVLRAPAIYGPRTGLHVSLAQSTFRLPGDGSRFSSRIHIDDLCQIILKAFSQAQPRAIFVVGDRSPAPYIDVVTWLCKQMSLPLPPSVPIEDVHHTLRADRQVDPSRVLKELDISLKYSSYKDGFKQCLESKANSGSS